MRATPRLLPLLYFLVGYVSLPLACAALAFEPRSLAGFYYHARLIGIVHLVTLGWITSTILGLLYLALPSLLRIPLPVRRGDYVAFGAFVFGFAGMVTHFWIQEFSGMAWSGLIAAAGIAHVGARVVGRALGPGPAPGVRLALVAAVANIGLAATAGVLLGFDKVHHFLPGYVLANVVSHAHLAALGWAAMMTLAFVYASAPADGVAPVSDRAIVMTVVTLEVGTLGLAIALAVASRTTVLFAALVAIAFSRFAADGMRMYRQRPRTLPRPHVGGWHVLQACLYLAAATAAGLVLAWMDQSAATLRLALAYGACGLVGFLAQALMGVQMRLVPMAYGLDPNRPCAVPAFFMWSGAVPLLALGFLMDSPRVLAIAGAAACIATIAAGVQGVFVVAPVLPRPLWLSWRRADHRRGSASHQLAVPPART